MGGDDDRTPPSGFAPEGSAPPKTIADEWKLVGSGAAARQVVEARRGGFDFGQGNGVAEN
jgi:hypothetical protein